MNRYATPKPRLQFHQQVHHLRADRHVQRRHRLVGDDQTRLRGQRTRDAAALPLPAGQFVRIALRMLRRQPDQPQQFVHAPLAPPRRRAADACGSARRWKTRWSAADRARRADPGTHTAPRAATAPRARGRAASHPRQFRRISPASGCSSRMMLRPVVDLPQPDSPTSASVSPCRTVSVTCSTAWMRPARRNHRRTSNRVVRPFTSSTGGRSGRTVACGCIALPSSGNGAGSACPARLPSTGTAFSSARV